jgi:NADH:ubiquinone oxidoreductase subunit 6 (subunit J)
VNVILLTVFVGAVLVVFFIAFFLHQTTGRHSSSERDALLPLSEEKPRPIPFDPPKP